MSTRQKLGKPQPQHSTLGDDAFDYHIQRARTPEPRDEPTRTLIAIADRMAARSREVTERDEVAAALLSGRDGLRSDRFLERVKAANRGTLIRFPSPDHDPDPEPIAAKAA